MKVLEQFEFLDDVRRMDARQVSLTNSKRNKKFLHIIKMKKHKFLIDLSLYCYVRTVNHKS